MIAPQLKSLLSPDLEASALPPDPTDCCVLFQAAIGPKNGEGEEVFNFEVVTPQYLARNVLPRWGRGALIVEQFSWPAVERALERLLAQAHRNSWREVAETLNHELRWEFDNYQPFAG
ncbi:MAG TPA: Imm8 family immunity protein [Burkholderiales bacterium]|nr:Imm8 family immunity protein [Burkholderiales bacterium]